jgi:hypothetical protein
MNPVMFPPYFLYLPQSVYYVVGDFIFQTNFQEGPIDQGWILLSVSYQLKAALQICLTTKHFILIILGNNGFLNNI